MPTFSPDNPFGYTFEQATRLSRVKEMTADELQRVIDMPEGMVQHRVRSAARARLRKLEKAATGAKPTRVTTSRRIRLNPAQKAHLIRFGEGTEADIFQQGKSKRTSDALYGRGLLSIVETNERTGFRTYVLTPEGETLYEQLKQGGDK